MKKNGRFKLFYYASMIVLSIVFFSGCSNTTTSNKNSGDTSKQNTSSNKNSSSSAVTSPIDNKSVPSLKGKKIGVAIEGISNNWERQAYQGQLDRIKELGGTAISVNGERNAQKHIGDIKNLITQKPDAIIKQLGDTKVYAPILKEVRAANIPLFTVDHPSEYSITNSSSDNYRIGEELARKMFEDIGGKGKIAVFNGFYGERTLAIRYDEMKYVAKDYPQIEFIQPELQDIINGTIEDSKKKVQDLLIKYPKKGDLKAIWAGWDIPAIGASQALVAAGRTDIKVYAVDGDPDAIKVLADKDSPFAADMAQQPYKIGQAVIDSMARYLNGEEVPRSVYMEPYLVTKDNVEEAEKILFNDKK
ncbi:sugar ABC transporter substrate-binding protein [Clostridium kluyveri]|uniref:sugar ABC transporter substrate-binding protein n=1 Tax=Clostridium kluyveri TaxID=1534 RepID=UPI0009FA0074|nr:sugar ABC transporter substrate-binding protein [Clostridium kluyveri]UZQ50449.1 sugar ABC transporter substrate-binding protein [Clostridium kluyveri]